MEFSELIRTRRSCRSYSSEPVSPEEIRAILDDTVLSASACNSQPWHFTVILDPEKRAACAEAVSIFPQSNLFAKNAAALIVLSTDKAPAISPRARTKYPSDHFAELDAGSAAAYFTLAAADRGLGTCILGAFDEEKIVSVAGLPDTVTPRLVITLGHPADADAPYVKKRTAAAEKTVIL